MREHQPKPTGRKLLAGCLTYGLTLFVFVWLIIWLTSGIGSNSPKPQRYDPLDTTLAGVPPAVQDYARKVVPEMRSIEFEAKVLSRLFDMVGDNIAIIQDYSWRNDVDQSLVRLQHASARLGTIQPVPPDMRDVDTNIKIACSEIPFLALNLNYGLQNLDLREFETARARAEKASDYIEAATAEVQRVSSQYPGLR